MPIRLVSVHHHYPPRLAQCPQITLIYGVRWHIELVFKLWKSQARLDVIGNGGPQRFLCQLYARLLGLLIFQWMLMDTPFIPDHELSLPKAFTLLQRYAARLRRAMTHDWSAVTALLEPLVGDFQRFAIKQKRRNPLQLWRVYLPPALSLMPMGPALSARGFLFSI